jgi:hypothetical protein
MADYYDDYYDDDVDYEALGDPFLMPDQFLLGDLSKSGNPEAYDIATFGRQLDNEKKLNAILRDPFFNYRVATETGANTFPYEQLFQPGNPWLPDPTGLGGSGGSQDYNALMNLINMAMGGGAPGSGGSGGGGSYGGGGGGNRFGQNMPDGGYLDESGELVIDTPTVTSMLRSTNPDLQAAGRSLEAGYDPASVIAKLYESTPDPELRTLYADQVKEGFKELSGASTGRNSWLSQQQQEALEGPGVGEASELGKTAAKWGVVDPLAQYGTDQMPLPDDVRTALAASQMDSQFNERMARKAEVNARVAGRDAVYGQPGLGVRAPQGAQGAIARAALGGPAKAVGPGFLDGGVDLDREGGPTRTVRQVAPGPLPESDYPGINLAGGLHPGFAEPYRAPRNVETLNDPTIPFSQSGAEMPEPAPQAPERRGGWSGLDSPFGLSSAAQRMANPVERNVTGFNPAGGAEWWLNDKGIASRDIDQNPRAPIISRNGQRVRTNSAGVRSQREQQKADYLRGPGPSQQQAIRDAYAGMVMEQNGRTPQRDAMKATLDYLRRSGMRM